MGLENEQLLLSKNDNERKNDVPQAQDKEETAKKYQRLIWIQCSVMAFFHALQFIYILILLDHDDQYRQITDDGRFSASMAFAFLAISTLLVLSATPAIVGRFRGAKLFREDMAIEQVKNYAIVVAACCVYMVEVVVMILNCLLISYFTRRPSDYTVRIASLATMSFHSLEVLVGATYLARTLKAYHQHNEKKAAEFDGAKDETKATKDLLLAPSKDACHMHSRKNGAGSPDFGKDDAKAQSNTLKTSLASPGQGRRSLSVIHSFQAASLATESTDHTIDTWWPSAKSSSPAGSSSSSSSSTSDSSSTAT